MTKIINELKFFIFCVLAIILSPIILIELLAIHGLLKMKERAIVDDNGIRRMKSVKDACVVEFILFWFYTCRLLMRPFNWLIDITDPFKENNT